MTSPLCIHNMHKTECHFLSMAEHSILFSLQYVTNFSLKRT